jgi:O-acetyl-ADP-ribose deacetylase (regulator of RNase III)
MKISVRRGDITDQPDVDAIVNAANTELWLGSGVAGAIRARGGPAVEREAVAQAPISLGQAVKTTAGNLPNRFVIHAAAMGYREEDRARAKREGSLSSGEIIREAVASSLALADGAKCRSIAFPALATGVGGFPVGECAQVMMAAAKDYAASHRESGIEEVVFVLFSAADYEAFERELRSVEQGSQADQ